MILLNGEDVLHNLAAAQHVYNTGFRRATNASPKYKSFGEDIRILSLNLDILLSVIRRAQLQHGTSHTPGHDFNRTVDEPQPEQVLGSLSGALSDCDRLLNDQRYFNKHDGYVVDIYWYYQVDPEVEKLRSRINAHNLKLVICLKILDPYILENNFLQIVDPFPAMHARIEQLGRQVRGYEEGIGSYKDWIGPVIIPPQLEDDFIIVTRGIYPDLSSIPLVRGIDAVIFCFENLGKTPDQPVHSEVRFLNAIIGVMKALWVLRTLQATIEFHITATYQPVNPFERHMALCGLTIGRFFQKFEEEIYQVLRPLVGKDLLLPPTPDLLEIFEHDKQLWPQDVCDGNNKKATAEPEHTELGVKVITAHLRSSEPGYTQSMQVYGQTEKRFNLVIVKANTLQGREREIVDGYDLEKVQIIPSYAMRTWSSPPLDPQAILFRVDSSFPVNRVLPFQQPKDMLEFQQSITGYKVIHDESRVLATSQESKIFGGSRRQDLCRLQLWTVTPPKTTSATPDPSDSPYLNMPGTTSRGLSLTSFTSSSNSTLQHRRKSTPSIFSTSSGPSSRSSVVMELSLPRKGAESGVYTAPTLPCVVLFSHKAPELGTDMTLRSFLIIDINPEVTVEEDLCESQDPRNPSYRCVIERKKGFLPARRSPETTDPDLWDLAAAGLHKRQSGTQEIKKLKHVIVQFDGQNNLSQFMTKFKQAKDLARLRLSKFMQATG